MDLASRSKTFNDEHQNMDEELELSNDEQLKGPGNKNLAKSVKMRKNSTIEQMNKFIKKAAVIRKLQAQEEQ